MTRPSSQSLRELAARADQIVAAGSYAASDGAQIDFASLAAASLDGSSLVRPEDWSTIEQEAHRRCSLDAPLAPVRVTNESTMAALHRLVVAEQKSRVAALNFASARNPGGGYRNGALAQEETLARSSALVPTLEKHWTYYEENRREASLLYTDHAIWSPDVPFFADDAGALLDAVYSAHVITMPAPNAGAMRSARDERGIVPTFERRIRAVLALAVSKGVQHLVLGAWGCGAFGNPPDRVASLFADALTPEQPWRRGLASVTFAIIDHSKRRASLAAFEATLGEQVG